MKHDCFHDKERNIIALPQHDTPEGEASLVKIKQVERASETTKPAKAIVTERRMSALDVVVWPFRSSISLAVGCLSIAPRLR